MHMRMLFLPGSLLLPQNLHCVFWARICCAKLHLRIKLPQADKSMCTSTSAMRMPSKPTLNISHERSLHELCCI